ncbi:hypothetical protein D884_03298 [Pseudomonas sp. URMO17WK12:I10]|uniref:hypothetical protein n=1 Tax=unclassified Pseudomonas TaxID=196821 RepID=UPI000483677E|nr:MULTISPECIES: hypothetical protein [unclassified Pseudomonas]RDL18477.1 hypothetical protein F633_02843 [Pseudomonas sp. LAMO17WK12:I3]RED04035.1 hypothetical protein D884_03298 [Pseudomonas sp. URMO17WK12:I10]SOD10307.1 hypothetical protein SAMN05660967_03522 [Pseudomonas sp. URMO17WK12:I9]
MQKTIFATCCVAAIMAYATALLLAYKLSGCLDTVILTYQTSIKGFVFAAFLGASSFLISLLTFLVINIKEKMFDSPEYLKLYVLHMNLKEGDYISKKDLYQPLRFISVMLVSAIFLSIISSLSQLTLGFSNNKFVLIIPTFTPFLAISFLISALFQIHSLIKQWLSSEDDVIKVSKDHM